MLERDVAEYLLHHYKEGIQDVLRRLSTDAKNNPILKTYFKDAVVDEVVIMLTDGMKLSYEEVAQIVDYNFLVSILGEEFFQL